MQITYSVILNNGITNTDIANLFSHPLYKIFITYYYPYGKYQSTNLWI